MNEEDLPIDDESNDDLINEDQTQDTDQEEEQGKPLSKIEQIAANRERQLLEEFGEDKKEEPVPAKQKVKVKIDGKEEEKDLDDIVSTYQKSVAADRRLQEASEKQKQLEQEWYLLQQAKSEWEKERNKPLVDEKEQGKAEVIPIDELKLRRREAMEIGDYEEFDRLDEEIANLRYKPSKEIDEDKIKQEASQTALDKIAYNDAYEKFKSSNEDLLTDRVLYQVTSDTFNQIVTQSKSYQEAFDTTAKLVREWVNGLTPQKQEETMADRVEKKKSIPNEPGRLNVKNTLQPEKEETPSDVIRNMRKARGLPV